MTMKLGQLSKACLLMIAATGAVTGAMASSHREAPNITNSPKVDGTDFYMFRSYEGVAANGSGGRSDYVTLLANYQPLQAPYGGPNYFQMDPNALYEIHVDNTGDGVEDITFQFKFKNSLKSIPLTIGTQSVPIPLIQAGAVSNLNDANLNVNETYEVKVVRGERRKNAGASVMKTGGGTTFEKPVDNIGTKTIADYAGYAAKHVFAVTIPGCPAGKDQGKVFVGQRQEGFAVNLGPANSNGAAFGAVIFTDSQYAVAIAKSNAIAKELKKAPRAKVLEIKDTPISTTTTMMPAVIASLLQKYGKKLTYMFGINGAYANGARPALRDAGKSPTGAPYQIAAGDGDSAELDRIRTGQYQAATVAEPLYLQAWQLVDAINSTFAKVKIANWVAAPGLIDKTNVP